jgi:hypothetical protein
MQNANDEQGILVNRTNGIRVLRKLESLARQGELRADLAGLRKELEMVAN